MPVLLSPVHIVLDGTTTATTPPLLGVVAATRIVENDNVTDDWLVIAFDSALKPRAHYRRHGAEGHVDWLDLLSAFRIEPAHDDNADRPRNPSINPIALARIIHVAQDFLDRHCLIGRPLRRLQHLTGQQYPIAREAIRDRKVITCSGSVCGGYAHGPVLLPDDFADALAAVLENRR